VPSTAAVTAPPASSAKRDPPSARAGRKFIAGEPMKPATNSVAGFS
jgi:hypothetical protein